MRLIALKKMNKKINSGHFFSIPILFVSIPSPIPGIELGIELNSHSIPELTPTLMDCTVFIVLQCHLVSIVGSLRDREVACSASDRQGSNFESCVWRTVSSQSSHHPQEVLLAQFSLYVHKGGLKPDSFFLQCHLNDH